MNEIWKPIKGYEGIYEVSDLGRVRSLPRPKTSRNASGEFTFTTKPKILKAFEQNGGYQRISFGRGKNKVAIFVHRLVAQAFIPNPDNLPHVNHKDENPKNNRADNLEWCNAEYNNSYGNHIERCKRHRAVVQMTKDGQEIATFDSIVEAEEKTGCRATSIQACCIGRYKSSCGYRWRYAEYPPYVPEKTDLTRSQLHLNLKPASS